MAATRTSSSAVAKAADKRTTYLPVVVRGISDGELRQITPSMFAKLDVDPSYQRGETGMIMQIIRAIQVGGKVLDPVTLCERRGSDKLWIVDGHQRVCAFQELKLPFMAMVHKSESAVMEHNFFVALNARKAVSANIIVKGWQGPAGTIIRKANADHSHVLYQRINFAQGTNETRISAASLARGIVTLLGVDRSHSIQHLLSRIDLALSKQQARTLVENYLTLVGRVSPKGHMPAMVLRALAMVGRERWAQSCLQPGPKVAEKFRCTNWAAEVVLVEKYMPMMLEFIRKTWK